MTGSSTISSFISRSSSSISVNGCLISWNTMQSKVLWIFVSGCEWQKLQIPSASFQLLCCCCVWNPPAISRRSRSCCFGLYFLRSLWVASGLMGVKLYSLGRWVWCIRIWHCQFIRKYFLKSRKEVVIRLQCLMAVIMISPVGEHCNPSRCKYSRKALAGPCVNPWKFPGEEAICKKRLFSSAVDLRRNLRACLTALRITLKKGSRSLKSTHWINMAELSVCTCSPTNASTIAVLKLVRSFCPTVKGSVPYSASGSTAIWITWTFWGKAQLLWRMTSSLFLACSNLSCIAPSLELPW